MTDNSMLKRKLMNKSVDLSSVRIPKKGAKRVVNNG